MFNNAHNFLVNGGTFNNVTNDRKRGIDLLREAVPPAAFHNSAERYDPPKCHPRTRVAVIDAIMAWIEDGQKTSFIMWLYGPAGAGKSAIAQMIAELCYQSGSLAASFFWSRSAAGRNNADRLVASLACQLIIAIPQLTIHVEEALENDHLLLSRSLEVQMESLIIEPLQKVFSHGQGELPKPKLIILDGLDECGTPQAQRNILKIISTAAQRFSISLTFLIASRPEQEIRDGFNTNPLTSITARLALDDTYHPDDDIRLFLVESFDSLKQSHTVGRHLPPAWPSTQDIDRLVAKSSGQFIYAATVVKFVSSPSCRPDQQLKIIFGITQTKGQTPFTELDALYRHIFSSVEDLPRALEILSCRFLLLDPDPDFQLWTAYNIEKFLWYKPGDLQLVLVNLHSVLNVPDIEDERGELQVLHASLQDFLMDPTRSGDFHIDTGRAHAQILRAMLRHWEHHTPDSDSTCKVIGVVCQDYCMVCSDYFNWSDPYTLADHWLNSSPTKELLADLFNFDFDKWVSECIQYGFNVYGFILSSKIFSVYMWLWKQEPTVQEHFGLEMSLCPSYSHSFKLFLGEVLDEFFNGYGTVEHFGTDIIKKHALTALTNPDIVYDRDMHPSVITKAFLCDHCDHYRLPILWFPLAFDELPSRAELESHKVSEGLVELQNFLRDPNRAGTYFVHSGMYAALSLHIVKFFLRKPHEDENGEIYGNHDALLDKALRWATKSLPFYLANANYTSELADYFRSHKFDLAKQCDDLHWDVEPFLEAIDTYVTVYDTACILLQLNVKMANTINQRLGGLESGWVEFHVSL